MELLEGGDVWSRCLCDRTAESITSLVCAYGWSRSPACAPSLKKVRGRDDSGSLWFLWLFQFKRSRSSSSSSSLAFTLSKKMLLLSGSPAASALLLPLHRSSLNVRRSRSGSKRRSLLHQQPLKVLSMAEESSDSGGNDVVEKAAVAGGLISTPVIAWSLYTLKTTGCGLPPGPGGSLGALEGASYLIVVGIIAWSLYTKARTGSGLPSGPFGLLGAVEGLSYLSLLAILVVFGSQFLDRGYIPGPLPADQCFG